MRKTVISNFYNEEYLLPFWLEHHKKIFDHGILINYHSTDRSVEIIKDICPTWEVRDTFFPDYNIVGVDEEIMDIEEEVAGAKIVLTMGEFFMDNGIDDLLHPERLIVMIPEVIMTDIEPEKPFKDLIREKNFGYASGAYRIFHTHENGNYTVGRHRTKHVNADVRVSKESYIRWYKFSPWNEKFINRKLAFKNRVRPEDIRLGMGGHYLWDRDKMEVERAKLLIKGKYYDN